MATDIARYHQTVVTAPTEPKDIKSTNEGVFDYDLNFPLYREIVQRDLVDEPTLKMELSSAESFFTGESMIDTSMLLSNLEYGQELIVNILKDQNPFSLFKSSQVEYEGLDFCHKHIKLDCTMECLNTLPTFDQLRFRFDCKYTYGVRMCAKNKDFWTTEFFTKQYALSKRACEFGREVDLWNEVIDGLVTAPATTVDAALAATDGRSVHFWDNLGTVTAQARCTIPEAVWYLQHSFSNINPTVFVTSEFCTELVKSVETYANLNFATQRINTFERWEFPGYQLAPRVKEILGISVPVVVLERSPWMTYLSASTQHTKYPLWSENHDKQYVAILDPRVGYSFEKDGYHLDIKPYDCDKLYAGMVDEIYVGRGITFPQLGMVLAFSPFKYC